MEELTSLSPEELKSAYHDATFLGLCSGPLLGWKRWFPTASDGCRAAAQSQQWDQNIPSLQPPMNKQTVFNNLMLWNHIKSRQSWSHSWSLPTVYYSPSKLSGCEIFRCATSPGFLNPVCSGWQRLKKMAFTTMPGEGSFSDKAGPDVQLSGAPTVGGFPLVGVITHIKSVRLAAEVPALSGGLSTAGTHKQSNGEPTMCRWRKSRSFIPRRSLHQKIQLQPSI